MRTDNFEIFNDFSYNKYKEQYSKFILLSLKCKYRLNRELYVGYNILFLNTHQ